MRMHIEFVGLPGSGKSTLHREALRLLVNQGQRAFGLPEAVSMCLRRGSSDKLLQGVVGKSLRLFGQEAGLRLFSRSQDKFYALDGFLARNPGLGQIVLSSQASRDISYEHKRLVLRWMLDLFAAFHFVRERLSDQELLALDEGFCNRVNTLFAYGPGHGLSDEEVSDYVDQIPRPDLVLVVDTSPELSEARLDHRGWTERLGRMSPAERRDVLERCSSCIELAITRLKERGAVVERIDNKGALTEAMAAMEELLSAVFQLG